MINTHVLSIGKIPKRNYEGSIHCKLKINFPTFIAAFCLLVSISDSLQAQEFSTFNSETFGDNYFSLELVKNQPLADSQKQLATGDLTFFIGFRHVLRDKWMMGVHGGYKQFKIKGENEEINIFSVYQESLYLIRLSHPIYLSIGPKLFFLLPTKGRKVPPERDRRFNREVGAAASIALHMFTSKNILVSFRIDRWRGVDSEIFQGSETSLGINYKLPN